MYMVKNLNLKVMLSIIVFPQTFIHSEILGACMLGKQQ